MFIATVFNSARYFRETETLKRVETCGKVFFLEYIQYSSILAEHEFRVRFRFKMSRFGSGMKLPFRSAPTFYINPLRCHNGLYQLCD